MILLESNSGYLAVSPALYFFDGQNPDLGLEERSGVVDSDDPVGGSQNCSVPTVLLEWYRTEHGLRRALSQSAQAHGTIAYAPQMMMANTLLGSCWPAAVSVVQRTVGTTIGNSPWVEATVLRGMKHFSGAGFIP